VRRCPSRRVRTGAEVSGRCGSVGMVLTSPCRRAVGADAGRRWRAPIPSAAGFIGCSANLPASANLSVGLPYQYPLVVPTGCCQYPLLAGALLAGALLAGAIMLILVPAGSSTHHTFCTPWPFTSPGAESLAK